jgi:pilus assembly protein CpaF
MNAKLSFEILGPNGRRHCLDIEDDGPIWLGRDGECHIVLPSNSVSRRHASVELGVDGLIVHDHSSNGTLVENRLLKGEAWSIGERRCAAQIGPYTLHIQQELPGRAKATESKHDPALDAEPASVPQKAKERARAEAQPPAAPHASASAALRRRLHGLLLDHLDLSKLDPNRMGSAELRPRVIAALERIVEQHASLLPNSEARERLVRELTDEALGLGPLEDLLRDPDVSEILVVDPETIYAEVCGKMSLTGQRFTDNEAARAAIERMVRLPIPR